MLPGEWSVIRVTALEPGKPSCLESHVLAMVLLVDQNLIFVSVPAIVMAEQAHE